MPAKVYSITRDCCASGNCVYCIGRSPFGQPMRVVQTTTTNPERATAIAENWRRLRARVEEVQG